MAHRLQTRVLKTQQLPKQQQQNCLKSSSVAKAEPGASPPHSTLYLLLLLPGPVSSQLTHLTYKCSNDVSPFREPQVRYREGQRTIHLQGKNEGGELILGPR